VTVPGEIVPAAAPAVPLDATVSLTVKHPAVGSTPLQTLGTDI